MSAAEPLPAAPVELQQPTAEVQQPAIPAQPQQQRQVARAPSGAAAAGPVGVLIGAGITLGITLLGRFLKGGGKRGKATEPQKSVQGTPNAKANQTKTSTPSSQKGSPGIAFGSPVTSVEPLTPSAHKPASLKREPQEPQSDTQSASKKDQSPAAAAKEQQTTAQDLAQMKQQLAMLVAMQEENAKLRAFMAQHLSTSEKLEKLETENNTLRAAQAKLESELADARSKASAVPVFSLSSGEELEAFKGFVASRLPRTEARSVCSDLDGAGRAAGGAASVASVEGGTAATVAAEFAGAVKKRSPGFWAELASFLTMTTPAASARPTTDGSSVAGGAQTPRGARSTYDSLPSQPATPRGGSTATGPINQQQAAKKEAVQQPAVSLDVAQLLDNFSGAGRF